MFVCAFNNTDNDRKKVQRDSYRKYFLLRVNITNYNVLIDCRNVHDQPINDQIKKIMKEQNEKNITNQYRLMKIITD